MAQRALSLVKSSNGQILIEGLFIIAFLIAFLILLQAFHLTAQSQIQKERLSKRTIKKQAPWLKSLKKGDL